MINLLPSQQKEELAQERRYKLLLIFGISIIIFFIALFLILFSIKIFIAGKAQEEKVVISPELQGLEEEIVSINKSLQNLASFYEKQPDFIGFLEKISQILPAGVYLTSFSWNIVGKEENFSVFLQGFSPTREILLNLKRNLESEPAFKDINFPPSNWVRPDNIDFSLNFIMQP